MGKVRAELALFAVKKAFVLHLMSFLLLVFLIARANQRTGILTVIVKSLN